MGFFVAPDVSQALPEEKRPSSGKVLSIGKNAPGRREKGKPSVSQEGFPFLSTKHLPRKWP